MESLTLNIDCDASNVESDVSPEEKHARVAAVVPGVAQDQASTPAKGVVVVGGEAQAKDVEHDLGWDRHAGGARTCSVALGSFQGAPTIGSTENSAQELGEGIHDLHALG